MTARISIARAFLAASLLLGPTAACESSSSMPAASTGAVTSLSVDELARLLASEAPPAVFDANGEETRAAFGLIPGAIPLPERKYDPRAVLPDAKDTKLVFYCGSLKCQSAEGAALRALAAGYSNVSVLPVGIRGWKGAGQKTQPYGSTGG